MIRVPELEPTPLERRLPAFNPHFEASLLLGLALCVALALSLAAIFVFQFSAGTVSPAEKAQPGRASGGSSAWSWSAPAVASQPIVRVR